MSAYRGRPEFVGAPLECREWPVAASLFLHPDVGLRGANGPMWPRRPHVAHSGPTAAVCLTAAFDPKRTCEADEQGARLEIDEPRQALTAAQQRRELLASIFDRLSQDLVKLLLAELLGLLSCRCVRRHLLCDRTGASCRRRPQLRGWPYLGPCRGRLVASLQALTGQHPADRVTTASEPTRYLRRALSCGPEPGEEPYVFRIPAHGDIIAPIAEHASI